MPRKKTQEDFIRESTEIHGNTYDYSKSDYITSDTKLVIICKVHGSFLQKPYNHIRRKQGCNQCGIETNIIKQKGKRKLFGEYLNILNMQDSKEKFNLLFTYNPETGEFKSKFNKNTNINWAGYQTTYINRQMYRTHRIIWTMMTEKIPDEIDHINHNRSDNTWVNLRNVTHIENTRNRTLNQNSKTGVMGVTLTAFNKYKAAFYIENNTEVFGYFDTIEEAGQILIKKRKEYGKYHENHGKKKETS